MRLLRVACEPFGIEILHPCVSVGQRSPFGRRMPWQTSAMSEDVDPMSVTEARDLAVRAHRDQRDRDGGLHIAHVARVAEVAAQSDACQRVTSSDAVRTASARSRRRGSRREMLSTC